MKNYNKYQLSNPEPTSPDAIMIDSKYPVCVRAAAVLAFCLSVFSVGAVAGDDSDIAVPVSAEPGAAGLGIATRIQNSLYRDGGTRSDIFPLYLYEGKRIFLESNRVLTNSSNCSSAIASKASPMIAFQQASPVWPIAARAPTWASVTSIVVPGVHFSVKCCTMLPAGQTVPKCASVTATTGRLVA